ncbi:alpha/beta fold hydrolase [Pseudarthrobacter sp. Y6]|uniref:alpha/beta fold hydrolase n=1 Tax=Pseudarthrobacter sp. Y6 TaxID=3418422 RepID=UPI003CF7407A
MTQALPRPARLALKYGPEDPQMVELISPSHSLRRRGLIVLIHGGYWRSKFDRSSMQPLAVDLVARGWAVANVEYRRVGNGGGWPTTLNDVRAALGCLLADKAEKGWDGPVIAIGHSAGGHLALLSVDQLDAVVALAPVTDLVRIEREGLGEDAALEFMGATAADCPTEYQRASPISVLPSGCPVLVVHGQDDERVPLAHSQDFTAAAQAVGDEISLDTPAGLGHFDVIDPTAAHWPAVVKWLENLCPSSLDKDGVSDTTEGTRM